MDETRWKVIEKSLDKIPTLSPVVSKVIAIANDLKSSPRDLMTVISLDPVLTAKVLKLVNSAYFGLSTNITSVNRALILLGVNTIKNLALSTAVLATMAVKEKNIPLDLDQFWLHSLGTAVASKLMGRALGVNDQEIEEYFICGLLHDIGKVPLIRFFPEDFAECMAIAERRTVSLFEAEDVHTNINHSQIGVELGNRWKLTPSLLFTIQYHHDPLRPGDARQLNQCVYLANNYCKKNNIGFGGNRVVESQYDTVLEQLGLDEKKMTAAFSNIEDEVHKAKIFLKVSKE